MFFSSLFHKLIVNKKVFLKIEFFDRVYNLKNNQFLIKFRIFSISAPPPPPSRYVMHPQLQSTSHYTVNHYVKKTRASGGGGANNMHPISWGEGGGGTNGKDPKFIWKSIGNNELRITKEIKEFFQVFRVFQFQIYNWFSVMVLLCPVVVISDKVGESSSALFSQRLTSETKSRHVHIKMNAVWT